MQDHGNHMIQPMKRFLHQRHFDGINRDDQWIKE